MIYNYLDHIFLLFISKMNNLKAERERIKIQKLLYKENKLIREQKEKELNNQIPIIIPTKTKKQSDGSQFSSIPLEKMKYRSVLVEVFESNLRPSSEIFTYEICERS